MDVKKCANGHYFDTDKYQLCPHCGAAVEDAIAPAASQQAQKKQKAPFWKNHEKQQNVAYRSMPTKTMGKTFSVFDEVDVEPPKGTKVVRATTRPVSNVDAGRHYDNGGYRSSASPDNVNRTASNAVNTEKPDNGADGVKRSCPDCGRPNSTRAVFCKYCGAKMESSKEKITAKTSQPVDAGTDSFDYYDADKPVRENDYYSQSNTDERIADTTPAEPDPFEIEKEAHGAFSERSAERSEHSAAAPVTSLKDAVMNAVSGSDGKTVGFFSMGTADNNEGQVSVDPVVGWLVCLKGRHLGESFSISTGRNAVGRGISNKITLSKDNKVSREKHVWITYEPKRRQFYVQPGEGSGLAYLNGEMVMESHLLHAKDKLEIGDGMYLLIPLCDETFSWEDYIR